MNSPTDIIAPGDLVAAALTARQRAYAPYSRCLVGAALRAADGTIFTGCNVENASFGLTQCAERAAVTAAVASGKRHFSELAIVSADAAMPCGACLQVLAEFCPELPIWLVNPAGQRSRRVPLSRLLPERFQFSVPASGTSPE